MWSNQDLDHMPQPFLHLQYKPETDDGLQNSIQHMVDTEKYLWNFIIWRSLVTWWLEWLGRNKKIKEG